MILYFYSRASMSIMQNQAPKLKETRNLNDKNCVQEMIRNIVDFLNHQGFPEYVSTKEIQKMDKQSFIKYFNVSFSVIWDIFSWKKIHHLFFKTSIVHLSVPGCQLSTWGPL